MSMLDSLTQSISVRWGEVVLFVGYIGMALIRAPHLRRSRATPVRERRAAAMDTAVLALTGLGNVGLPLVAARGRLQFATRPLEPWELALGCAVLIAGLWFFYRSHADLGANWSVTLELRSEHRLVTRGVYARVRHPMYSALLLIALAQSLLIANWVAGLSGLIVMMLMFWQRVAREEQMMADAFGEAWLAYATRTPRILPRLRDI